MAEDKQKPEDEVNLDDISIEQEPATEPSEDTGSSTTPAKDEGLKAKKKPSWLKRLWSTKKGKALIAFLVIVITVGVLYAVPTTRYGILGNFVKKDVRIVITDSMTKKPVSQAVVKINGQSETTSEKGEATIKNVPVGEYTLETSKKYYKDTKMAYEVPVFGNAKKIDEQLEATGRQVEVKVTNTITKAALAKASIVVGDTSAITDSKGVATIVLPVEKKTLTGKVTLDGYNDATVVVTVTEDNGKNVFSLTPQGNVFYLSNATDTVNIMKVSLDGTSPTIAVKGTGNEDDYGTRITVSNDWRYIALFARRVANDNDQLYLVDTRTNVVTLIDQGNAQFNQIGWIGHTFLYSVDREDKRPWQSGSKAIKSYNAETSSLRVIAENHAHGSDDNDKVMSSFGSMSIVDQKLVYGVNWWVGGSNYEDIAHSEYRTAIISVNADGTNKTTLRDFAQASTSYVNMRSYKAQALRIKVEIDATAPKYFEYQAGKLSQITITDRDFNSSAGGEHRYFSATSSRTMWTERRDGRNIVMVGDKNGNGAKSIFASSSYLSGCGWYGDGYVLLCDPETHELSIVSVTRSSSATTPIQKITNYHGTGFTYLGWQ